MKSPRNADIRLYVVVLAAGLTGYFRWARGDWVVWPLVLGAVVLAYFSLVPRAMLPIANRLMALISRVGHVNNAIVLGVMFFAIITPLGAAMRLLRGQRIQIRRARASYWVVREDKGADIDFTKMY
jgi:hypothetical protein